MKRPIALSGVEMAYFVWWQSSAFSYLVTARLNDCGFEASASLRENWLEAFVCKYNRFSVNEAEDAIENVFSTLDADELAATDRQCKRALYNWIHSKEKSVSPELGLIIYFAHNESEAL
jgi:hypothetical protein